MQEKFTTIPSAPTNGRYSIQAQLDIAGGEMINHAVGVLSEAETLWWETDCTAGEKLRDSWMKRCALCS